MVYLTNAFNIKRLLKDLQNFISQLLVDRAQYYLREDGGHVPEDSNLIVFWIESILESEKYEDSWRRLDKYEIRNKCTFNERHAFIVASNGTKHGIYKLLGHVENNVPNKTPNLPKGITHIWIPSDLQG